MNQSLIDSLKWQMEHGADEAISDEADYFKTAPSINTPALSFNKPAPHPEPSKPAPAMIYAPLAAAKDARQLADQAETRDQLEAAVRSFNGLAIKNTATNTVFSDGNPNADVMLIGEAPGAQEDQQGIPFCGRSGHLLDTMLATIGLNREKCYITNTLFWRPPGNRRPTDEELETCLPFVEKHIALIKPKLLVLVGGTATYVLLDKKNGITKLRQKSHSYTNPLMGYDVPTHVLFHPSYLLRSPLQKKLAWQDLLAIRHVLTNINPQN